MHRLQDTEIKNLRMPAAYNKEKTAGIMCIEMFDLAYCSMLCGLDIPLLLVDSPVTGLDKPLGADRLITAREDKDRIHRKSDTLPVLF